MIFTYYAITAILTWNAMFPDPPIHIHAEEVKIKYEESNSICR